MLKELTMVFVRDPQILPKKPAAIRRNIVHRIKLIAQKRWGHQADALLRNLGTHGVDVPKRWRQPVKKITTLGCALNPAFLIVRGWRRWRSHFPHQRGPMLRIRREQPMQDAGP